MKDDRLKNKSFNEKYNMKWVVLISLWTFIMAAIFSVISERLVENLNIYFAFIVLIIIIFIGILFDIIGIAVTTAEEKPFHAMAANKISEGKYAIKLVRNASQVSNFCNDVIGDISGIISGAIGTNIVFNIITSYRSLNSTILSLVITSLIAAFTVGGKAIGKTIAMENYEGILYVIAKILYVFETKLGIELFKEG